MRMPPIRDARTPSLVRRFINLLRGKNLQSLAAWASILSFFGFLAAIKPTFFPKTLSSKDIAADIKQVIPSTNEFAAAVKEVVPSTKEIVTAVKEVVPSTKEIVTAIKEVVPSTKDVLAPAHDSKPSVAPRRPQTTLELASIEPEPRELLKPVQPIPKKQLVPGELAVAHLDGAQSTALLESAGGFETYGTIERGTIVLIRRLEAGFAEVTWTNPPNKTSEVLDGWLSQRYLGPHVNQTP